jgi:hypothetical protein
VRSAFGGVFSSLFEQRLFMAISEPVRSLETHKLMPGDIYPHPAVGRLIPCNPVRSVFAD